MRVESCYELGTNSCREPDLSRAQNCSSKAHFDLRKDPDRYKIIDTRAAVKSRGVAGIGHIACNI
jgi:hypothetical protein